MKKILLVLMLVTLSLSMVNAGKLDALKKIAEWAKNNAGWIIGIGVSAPAIVSAAGYEDSEYSSASDDIDKAVENCKITYDFTLCPAKNGDKVAVSNDVVSCHDGSTPQDGITIDLSKLLKDNGC